MTAARELLPVAADGFGRRVHGVGPAAWTNDTPDADWTVRDLVNHLVVEHLWVPHLLGGQSVADVGDRYDGDVLGDDPVAAWDAAIRASLRAWGKPGTHDTVVELSSGPAPIREYAEQMLMDLTVHSWDLSRGIGYDDRLDRACVEHALAYVEANLDDFSGSGLFGPPVQTTSDDPQDRLLAALGRHP